MDCEWQPSDPLAEALYFLRMKGMFYCRSELTAPWSLTLPGRPGYLSFHVVTSGRCWLEFDGGESYCLDPFDLVLVPHGTGHRLASQSGMIGPTLEELPVSKIGDRYAVLRYGGGGTQTNLICGAVSFDHVAADHLIELLPQIIHIQSSNAPHIDWIQSILRLMSIEAREPLPGGETVITRLADVLVIQAIRTWIQTDPAARSGWLGALQDPKIGRALTLIHRDPARQWTVASLASEVAMSRSAFSARFTELVGASAMQYVARWRIHIALSRLKEKNTGIADIASYLGYQSEAAFSRAFKRFVGMSPGRARHQKINKVTSRML